MASEMPVFARSPAPGSTASLCPAPCLSCATAPRRAAAPPTRGRAGQGRAGQARTGATGLAHKANGLVGSWFQLGLLLKGGKQLPRRGEAA